MVLILQVYNPIRSIAASVHRRADSRLPTDEHVNFANQKTKVCLDDLRTEGGCGNGLTWFQKAF